MGGNCFDRVPLALVEGNILKEQFVKKGESAVAPSNTEKEGFIFLGWDKDFSNITENLDVKGIYKEISSDVTVYKIILDPDGGVVENTEISFIENNSVLYNNRQQKLQI